VVQSLLFFALGFLCAGLLALMAVPAVWRRAARLTRKRVEASIPLTLDEIQADKDRMRAEFAVTIRRLEVRVKELRDTANLQLVEIGQLRKEIGQLTIERDQKARIIADLESADDELRSSRDRQAEEITALTNRIAEKEFALEQRTRDLQKKSRELEKMNELHEEVSLELVDLQAELLQRTSEVEKLEVDLTAAAKTRRVGEKRAEELERELNSARAAMDAEKARAAELDHKIEGMTATIAELRDARSKEGEKSEADRRLEERLLTLTRENRKLKADLKRAEKAMDASSTYADDSDLREQMNNLAAEVISLTSKLEGPDSPIRKALEVPGPGGKRDERPISLADRVLALRKAAADQADVTASESL
jgi:chromosome segregation ATPase